MVLESSIGAESSYQHYTSNAEPLTVGENCFVALSLQDTSCLDIIMLVILNSLKDCTFSLEHPSLGLILTWPMENHQGCNRGIELGFRKPWISLDFCNVGPPDDKLDKPI